MGHVRTAILTWILARQLGGDYFVRFEKTDKAKELAGAREAIVADLDWLGLLGSEEPHDQTDMTSSYRAALARLTSAGDTCEDGAAIRFRSPNSGEVQWDDLVRGTVVVSNDDLDDPVLVRSNGTPTFYLASTVDDADDCITHLVRTDPLLRSTAKQMHIWRSLGVEAPLVGHVPLVTTPRSGSVRVGIVEATVRAIRDRGTSPTALLAYLAIPETASWKTPPGSVEEIIELVELGRLPRRPTTFDLRALEVLDRRLTAGRASHSD